MAGGVLAIGLLGAGAVLAVGLTGVAGAAVISQRAAAAADAAALAAADGVTGAVVGEPCGLAARLAQEHGATLVDCSSVGVEATVTVRISGLAGGATARARAGPPPD